MPVCIRKRCQVEHVFKYIERLQMDENHKPVSKDKECVDIVLTVIWKISIKAEFKY